MDTKIRASCGCKWHVVSDDIAAVIGQAAKHTSDTGHTVAFAGEIRMPKVKA